MNGSKALAGLMLLGMGTAPAMAADAAEDDAGAIVVTGRRYLDARPASATKTDTPVVETPQSVTTVTRDQIDDQNVQSVGQALRYSAGTMSDVEISTRYDSVFLRGFGGFGAGGIAFVSFLDGLRLPRGQAFAHTSVDPFLLDHVDILKGPPAVLYGQVSPGGLVNQVSRQPTDTPYNEVRVEAGSYGRIQGGLTSQGSLAGDGRLLYSLTAIGRSSDTRYDGIKERRIGVAPALTWRPDGDTQLTVSGYYQRDPEGGYQNSIYARTLAPAQYRPYLNSKLNVGDPAYDEFKRTQYGVGYNFLHRFGGGLTVRSALRFSQVDADTNSVQVSGFDAAAGSLLRFGVNSTEWVHGLSTDNQLQADFTTGAVTHKLLVGIDHSSAANSWTYFFGSAPALDVINPVYGQAINPTLKLIDSRQTVRQTGLYAQDQISLDRWRLTLSLRHDWTRQTSLNRNTSAQTEQSDEATTVRAGLLYLTDIGLAPYVSYSTSFEPTIGVDAAGNSFAPRKGKQYEVGLKYQPVGAPLLLTASVFDLAQTNVLTPGTIPGFSVQQGEIRSRGLELEARGSVTDRLEIIAAATSLDTEVRRSTNAALVGNRPQAVPKQFASLWASYRFAGAVNALTLAGGLRYVGKSFGDDANTLVTPSYVVADAGLRFALASLSDSLAGAELTFNVSNLFDREYYNNCNFSIYCQFGNRRHVLGGLRYHW